MSISETLMRENDDLRNMNAALRDENEHLQDISDKRNARICELLEQALAIHAENEQLREALNGLIIAGRVAEAVNAIDAALSGEIRAESSETLENPT